MGKDTSDLIFESLQALHGKFDEMIERIVRLEVQGEQNTKDLEEHIEGVMQTRVLIEQHETRDKAAFREMDTRIEELETPSKVRNYLTKGFLWLGSLSGAGIAIYNLVKSFS